MDSYERDQDRVQEMLDLPSSELGEVESDFSDVEVVDMASNAEINSDSEESFGVEEPVQMDVDEELNNDELSIPGPSHQHQPLDLSQHDGLDPSNLQQNQRVLINPTYTGRNRSNPTIWSNIPQQRPGRIRRQNIVTQLPGPKRQARNARSEMECWSLFFPETIIKGLVVYTNIKIRSVQENYARVRDARETDVCEVKALIGLLYLAGISISAKQNTLDLWKKDGLGVEMFGLVIGVNRKI